MWLRFRTLVQPKFAFSVVGCAMVAAIVAVVGISGSAEDTSDDEHVSDFKAPSAAEMLSQPGLPPPIATEFPTDQEHHRILIFPSGRTVDVTWRARSKPGSSVIAAINDNTALRDLALAGDPFAPLIVHDRIVACNQSPANEEELRTRQVRLQETHTMLLPPDGRAVYVEDASEIALLLDRMERAFLECRSLHEAIAHDSTNWLRLAADNGNSVAMVDFANSIDDADLALSYFSQAWNAGDAFGLHGIYKTKLNQYESGADPEAKLDAYAAHLAYSILTERRLSMTGSHSAARAATRVREELNSTLATLLPNERRAVENHARNTIQSNGKCCLDLL